MTEQELLDIEKRWEKATPGPWMWDVNEACKSVHLTTTHSGRYFVMGFRRWGMGGAQPIFQKFKKYFGPVNERESLGISPLKEFAVPRMKHHPDFDMDIDHPDAQAITHAPADVQALLEEVRRLKENVRNMATMNDSHVKMIYEYKERRDAELVAANARIAELEETKETYAGSALLARMRAVIEAARAVDDAFMVGEPCGEILNLSYAIAVLDGRDGKLATLEAPV